MFMRMTRLTGTGLMLLTSVGTSAAQDTNEPALVELRLAAEQGDVQAQYRLGRAYEAQFDLYPAAIWYQSAADQGLPEAQYRLAVILMRRYPILVNARVTTPTRDDATGVQWYLRAAAQGHPHAQLALGRCYRDGTGVYADYIESYKWFSLAVSQKIAEAGAERRAILYKMTGDQIKEAQQRVKDFVPAKESAPTTAGQTTNQPAAETSSETTNQPPAQTPAESAK